MTHGSESPPPSPLRKLAVLGVLIFLPAGPPAPLYAKPAPFLLPQEAAFALIPLGYLSFIPFAVILLWLAVALRLMGARPGFIFGLKLGALIWGAVAMGLASVSTASPALLLGWFVGQTVEMGIGGAVAGEGLQRDSLRPLVLGVVLLLLASIILTILLQSLGLAPAARVL